MGKYDPLQKHLEGRTTPTITLSWSDIEKLIGEPLPPSAFDHDAAWWANNEDRHVQARAWLWAGWKVGSVDVETGTVTFRRTPDRTKLAASS